MFSLVFSWKIHMFFYYIQASKKIRCVLEITFKKVAPEKKNTFFSKIVHRLVPSALAWQN